MGSQARKRKMNCGASRKMRTRSALRSSRRNWPSCEGSLRSKRRSSTSCEHKPTQTGTTRRRISRSCESEYRSKKRSSRSSGSGYKSRRLRSRLYARKLLVSRKHLILRRQDTLPATRTSRSPNSCGDPTMDLGSASTAHRGPLLLPMGELPGARALALCQRRNSRGICPTSDLAPKSTLR